ncbi:MAG: diguanylate cyclase [Lachnospirales bacterium]
MKNDEIQQLIEQIRCIALGKDIGSDLKVESENLEELQEGLIYLSKIFTDASDSLSNLSKGNLEFNSVQNYSLLSNVIKDLHSKMKYFAWQVKQVSDGNYSQSVSFLGDFSENFNQMIEQLAEREDSLKKQSVLLSRSVELLKLIMNRMTDDVLVISIETKKIIFRNDIAKNMFCNYNEEYCKSKGCSLVEHLKNYDASEMEGILYEHYCPEFNTTLMVTSFTIYWDDKLAYVHFIKDITDEKEVKLNMEKMVYIDQLTDVYNRRYCMEEVSQLINERKIFVACMVDIDNLKVANDNFGHNSGDFYIKKVTEGLVQGFDGIGSVCRIGGDELFIISLGDNLEKVLEIANDVDERLSKIKVGFRMSISYGAYIVNEFDDITNKDVFNNVDDLMYNFKRKRKRERRTEYNKKGM